MKLGQALIKVRKARGLSQLKASIECNISQTYLSQLETGQKTSPSLDILERLGTVYNVPIQVIIFGSIEESDVSNEKLEAYRLLKPSIDSLIDSIFLS